MEKLLINLVDLIGVLKKSEIETARKHIRAYSTNHTGSNNKMLELFNEINRNTTNDFDSIKKKVSRSSNNASFYRLIRRTTERVQESLIVDVNIFRKDSYSLVFKNRFISKKLLMQAHIIQGRGLVQKSNEIYDKVIRLTKKFELFDELEEALFLKTTLLTDRRSIKKLEQINFELSKVSLSRKYLRETKTIYQNYYAKNLEKINHSEKIELLVKNISIVDSYYKLTFSSNILSFYYLLSIELHNLTNNEEKSIETAYKLLSLIRVNKSLFSIQRIAYLQNNISESKLYKYEFIESLKLAKQTILLTKHSPNFNYLEAVQINVSCEFFLGNYGNVVQIIKKVQELSVYQKYSIKKVIFNYFLAMSFFLQRDYLRAKVLLYDMEEIEQDKDGWNVWIRVMRILCSIEMLKLNMIEYDVENFRKFIQRTDKRSDIRSRDKIILKILLDLDKYNYDFKKVNISRSRELNILNEKKQKESWNIKSAEKVAFHLWFKCKVDNTEYIPVF